MSAEPTSSKTRRWPEWAGVAFVLGLTGFFLATSWRKWNDPVIDFGRELYTPWRISEGAVLYRDIDSVYGPLSQYFNAALFKVFGPGLMVLVTANLLIFSGILALAYGAFRRAWGVVGAIAASIVFVTVFAFAEQIPVGNFNYATPYAHEATHGMLVCLGLLAVAQRWVVKRSLAGGFALGVGVGLTLVLKPEFMVASVAVTGTAVALSWSRGKRLSAAEVGVGLLGVVLPSLVFAIVFAGHMPWGEAMAAAGNAWLAPLTNPIAGKAYQMQMLGLDDPARRIRELLVALGGAVVLLGGLGVGLRQAFRLKNRGVTGAVVAVLAALSLIAGWKIEWLNVGRCLLGLGGFYFGWLIWKDLPALRDQGGAAEVTEQKVARVLTAVLALALMARMVLFGRIYQFGFFQAALCAMMITAAIFTDGLKWVSARPRQQWLAGMVFGLLLGVGLVSLTMTSQQWLRKKTYAIGEGRDRFYTFERSVDGSGDSIAGAVKRLSEFPANATLLVVPEGLSVNYLARRRSPLPQFQFYSFTTENGREKEIVRRLEQTPPDLVVIANRELTDFGINRYGERSGAGLDILLWVQKNYRVVEHINDDPFDPHQRGAYVLARNPAGQ